MTTTLASAPVAGWPGRARAQSLATRSGATLELGGRLHAQLAASSAPDGRALDVFVRRARLEADLGLGNGLAGRLQVEFSGPSVALKDAYARLELNPFFVVDMGQFKRAFDPFELSSSTELALVERDGRIDGLDGCSGVGGICSFSRFTERLEYSDRDVGVRIHGRGPEDAYDYTLTLTNGSGPGVSDENDAKSLAARATVAAWGGLRVGAGVSLHDYEASGGGDEYAGALEADLTLGEYRRGLHIQAAVAGGDNWRILDEAGHPGRFVTAQALVAYYLALDGNALLEAVEPAGRISWGDPDTATPNDAGILFTPGFFAYFQGRNRVGFNLDLYAPQGGDAEVSFKLMWFLYF